MNELCKAINNLPYPTEKELEILLAQSEILSKLWETEGEPIKEES